MFCPILYRNIAECIVAYSNSLSSFTPPFCLYTLYHILYRYVYMYIGNKSSGCIYPAWAKRWGEGRYSRFSTVCCQSRPHPISALFIFIFYFSFVLFYQTSDARLQANKCGVRNTRVKSFHHKFFYFFYLFFLCIFIYLINYSYVIIWLMSMHFVTYIWKVWLILIFFFIYFDVQNWLDFELISIFFFLSNLYTYVYFYFLFFFFFISFTIFNSQ